MFFGPGLELIKGGSTIGPGIFPEAAYGEALGNEAIDDVRQEVMEFAERHPLGEIQLFVLGLQYSPRMYGSVMYRVYPLPSHPFISAICRSGTQ